MAMQKIAQVAAVVFMLMTITLPGPAQTPANQTPAATTTPQANPGDVDSIDHILSAIYESISGPAGPRNWERFRSLFYTDARLIPSYRDPSGKVAASSRTVEQYIDRAKTFFDKEGFFEVAVANRIEVWDHIAHVWSTYESRHAKGEKPFARGINSFQLLNDGTRWWVVTIYWEGEDPGHPIPEKYLK